MHTQTSAPSGGDTGFESPETLQSRTGALLTALSATPVLTPVCLVHRQHLLQPSQCKPSLALSSTKWQKGSAGRQEAGGSVEFQSALKINPSCEARSCCNMRKGANPAPRAAVGTLRDSRPTVCFSTCFLGFLGPREPPLQAPQECEHAQLSCRCVPERVCELDLPKGAVEMREDRWPTLALCPASRCEMIRIQLCSQALGHGLAPDGTSQGMSIETMLMFNSFRPTKPWGWLVWMSQANPKRCLDSS